MSSVPKIQFTPQGLIVPTDTDILAGAQIDLNSAFGGGVNPALNTPQGQLASSTAAIVSDKDAEIALLVTQVDPQYATGRFQDAIGRFYFMERLPARSTVVACILTGLGGTVVPVGTLAQDTAGNTYSLTEAVTIGSGGTVLGSFANVLTGPIACPANTLTQVYQALAGWDAIGNPADGVLGQVVESPSEFELRRQGLVAGNRISSVQAIQAAVFAVRDVLDCYVIDNPSGVVVDTGFTNYPMLPHSIYVGVIGGIDADIANAIWLKKDTGCDCNGNTSVPVSDSINYSVPYPTYLIKFNRPTSTPILFAVSIVNSSTLPSNIVDLVQAAIVAQFAGTRIGSSIAGSSYYGAVISVAPGVVVLSVLVGISSATLPYVVMGIDQAPVINAGNITVTLVTPS